MMPLKDMSSGGKIKNIFLKSIVRMDSSENSLS
jgi:hypothetical protein